MYSVNVRDHFMIAHSFRGEVFGPAQRLHGATYVVDLEFRRAELDADGMVVDIALATEVLRSVLARFNLRNLDDDPAFKGRNTTTEFMARVIFDRVAVRDRGRRTRAACERPVAMRVRLNESHVAWAAYEGALPARGGVSEPAEQRAAASLCRATWRPARAARLRPPHRRRPADARLAGRRELARDGFPAPDAAARRQRSRVFEALPNGALVVVDGLAFGALPDLVGPHARACGWSRWSHHPLALETGLDPAAAARAVRERAARPGAAPAA